MLFIELEEGHDSLVFLRVGVVLRRQEALVGVALSWYVL